MNLTQRTHFRSKSSPVNADDQTPRISPSPILLTCQRTNRGVWTVGVVAAFSGILGISPLKAELPAFTEKDWLGYFVGLDTKTYKFGITAQGKATLRLLGKNGEPLNEKLGPSIQFLVEEVMPDGKVVAKAFLPESLESAQPPTLKPKNVVFQGKVAGDAKFEVTMHQDGDVILLGGRILDPGTLIKNPLRFSIRLKFDNAYPYEKADRDKKAQKEFENKIKDDRIQLSWTDGKRGKQSTSETVDAASAELNGPGIATARIEFSSYQGHKLQIAASPPSLMKISNSPAGPLQNGFLLTWISDPAKDPQAKARLSIEVK